MDDACGVCGAVAALVAVMWGRAEYPPTAAACDRRLLLSTGGECSIDVVIDCAEHSLLKRNRWLCFRLSRVLFDQDVETPCCVRHRRCRADLLQVPTMS